MAFDSSRLKAASDFASLIVGSNLFQISELKSVDDQWPRFLLTFLFLFYFSYCSNRRYFCFSCCCTASSILAILSLALYPSNYNRVDLKVQRRVPFRHKVTLRYNMKVLFLVSLKISFRANNRTHCRWNNELTRISHLQTQPLFVVTYKNTLGCSLDFRAQSSGM